MKIRQNLYLDRKVSDALEALAAKPGTNKSLLVNHAVSAWLARRASHEIDELLQPRLDRITHALAALRRDNEVLRESLALFVRYQLTVTAPLPESDQAALAVGRDRFEAFVRQVGKALASGRSTLAFGSDAGQGT